MIIVGYILAVFVGISLGLIGSGGSILTVPILVYIMGVDPVLATAYSLFIVGVTAMVGSIQSGLQKNIDFKTAIIFGLPSIISVYLTRAYLLPLIPENVFTFFNTVVTKNILLMVLFAIVMIAASVSMIVPQKKKDIEDAKNDIQYNYPLILLEGLSVGLLTGLVGAGGGFLIIPALVLLAKMPIKKAIGTSLVVIATKSLIGFSGDLTSDMRIDWQLLTMFTLLSVLGIFIGIFISKIVSSDKLKSGFGWFVLAMGVYILIKEIVFP